MGQIVIEIPDNKKRRYILRDIARIDRLLTELDDNAIRVKNLKNELTIEELEDIHDIATSTRALREIAETGRVYSWESVKAELDI
jgi:hypothetical protein